MERNAEENYFLLEKIKNELVSIMENRAEDIEVENRYVAKPLDCDANSCNKNQTLDRASTLSGGRQTLPNCRDGLLQQHFNSTIDVDLQKMKVSLKESYELFQSVGVKFENINFHCLKSRIKDLHLSENNNDTIRFIVKDLHKSFDQKYMDNRLSDLTKEVRSKFHKHPGEFGDIPELSEFYRACSQLQHGIDALQKQRQDIQDLTKRMNQVAEASFNRINEVQNTLKEELAAADMKNMDENKKQKE